MVVQKKLFEIWLHLDVHLQEIVKIVVCNSDIGFKKIGESLYTTKILASKKLLKVSMPPRYWLRRNWWKLLPPEERMFHSLWAPLPGFHHSCDVWRTLYISFSCYFLSNDWEFNRFWHRLRQAETFRQRCPAVSDFERSGELCHTWYLSFFYTGKIFVE